MRTVRVLAAATAVTLVLGASAAPAAEAPGLEFVAPSKLVLTASGGESSKVSVWLANASDGEATPTFTASLEDGDGDAVPSATLAVVTVDDDGKAIPTPAVGANSVERYRLFLKGGGMGEDLSGQLIATAEGLAPASVAVTVAPNLDTNLGILDVNWVLVLALVGALIVILLSWSIVSAVPLKTPLGDVNLDFGTSFASTLTAVGALLGTVISASLLPEDTVTLSSSAFAALNLLFLVAVVVAGLVYSALQTPVWVPKEDDPSREERALQGTVWAFLLACFITVWAVYGELLTLWLLVDELDVDGGLSGVIVWIFRILLLGSAVAMVVYTWWRIPSIVVAERDAPVAPAAGFAAAPAPARPRRISLL
jgi:hypothetical protein